MEKRVFASDIHFSVYEINLTSYISEKITNAGIYTRSQKL